MTTYTNLFDAIQDPIFNGLSNEDTLNLGNQLVTISTSQGTLWRYDGVATQFGTEAAEGLYAAILGAGLPGAAATMISPGVDLSLPSVQSQLILIGQAVPTLTALCQALMAIGITKGTWWQLQNLPQPLLSDIAATRLQISNNINWITFLNEQLHPLLMTKPTPTQIKALVASWSAI